MTVVPASEGDAPSENVHLLVSHDRNRRLLTERLAERYDVTASTSAELESSTVDLCVVDARSFERHRELLASKKAETAPVFLPYVLLTDHDRRARVPGEVWNAVDELLTTPLDSNELLHRLENLLERRRLSLDLKRRKQRSDERFRTLFETAPDPIVVTSEEGIVSDVNESFARTFQLERDDVVGKSVSEFDVSADRTVERVFLRVEESTRSDDEPTAETVEWELDSGERLVTELNADLVVALGAASDKIGIFRDVTEREEREDTLRDQNERLTEFASTIAHDLRNPLTIAQGHLELCEVVDGDEHLTEVRRAHARMEQLIDELLTLAREGQVVLDPEPVSLSDVVEDAWAHSKTAEATLAVETDESILADAGRLAELFENLFRNAVEHGGETVAVEVGTLADASGFYVQDDGSGIPEADRDSVFEAGYTTSETGTGFGLSIVQQIVDGHGWNTSVTASPAGGARFEFRGVSSPADET